MFAGKEGAGRNSHQCHICPEARAISFFNGLIQLDRCRAGKSIVQRESSAAYDLIRALLHAPAPSKHQLSSLSSRFRTPALPKLLGATVRPFTVKRRAPIAMRMRTALLSRVRAHARAGTCRRPAETVAAFERASLRARAQGHAGGHVAGAPRAHRSRLRASHGAVTPPPSPLPTPLATSLATPCRAPPADTPPSHRAPRAPPCRGSPPPGAWHRLQRALLLRPGRPGAAHGCIA
jgi:hypothetical protein